MKEQYSAVVLGASYYGLGYAASHPDCLILEGSQSCGGEFHQCLHPVQILPGETGGEMGALMREYGVWSEESFDLLKAQTVVHEYAARQLENGLEILLDARVMSVEAEETGTKVTFVTNEGIRTVLADRLVDTTADCISAPEKVQCTAKSLNVFTVAQTETFAEDLRTACPDCCVLDGPMENEKLIRFPVEPETSLVDAYCGILNVWKNAFPEGQEKILFVAENFDGVYAPAGEMPQNWVGQRFDSPMEAFEKGAAAK